MNRNFAVPGLLLTAVSLLFSPAARSGTLFSQGSPNGNSFDITDFRLADDFQIAASASVNEIGFWYQAQQQTDLSSVAYGIYADQSGALGNLLASGATGSITTTMDAASGLFFADFTVPAVTLGPGAFWLELHAGQSLVDNTGFLVSWAAAPENASRIALDNFALGLPDTPVNFTGFDQYGFVLSGQTVPEPATTVLVAIGAALVLAGRLRRGPCN